ncbi:unnamed protein product [Sphenostylis stenocarpa]|uniref:Uncharacterized protein n=1 Tax=Sphenostylis stenocarpa TaxID=92480 RepID=A0AA86SVR1_9FABA|nr:unnamed protein product [Sphenostylis stenocarpa]
MPYNKEYGPIHRYIEALDKLGRDVMQTGDPDKFKQYLSKYKNTICGCHPISVYMQMLKNCSTKIKIEFLRYEQLNQCKSARDSSVSYASAVAKIDGSSSV